MNTKKYIYTLYLTLLVISCTVGIQIYWNYKNYVFNKQQLVKDIQVSLDKAVDDYYTDLAKKNTLGFEIDEAAQNNVLHVDGFLEKMTESIDESYKKHKTLDSINLNPKQVKGITVFKGDEADSLFFSAKNNIKEENTYVIAEQSGNQWIGRDSVNLKKIGLLTSKIVISIKTDSVDLKHIDSLLKTDLVRKKIPVDYHLKLYEKTNFLHNDTLTENSITVKPHVLSAASTSSFLPKNNSLIIYFENINWAIFQRILSGIFISLLLVLTVIGCLFYLLKIINKQKQLAEIKNDLISNITHEFKTPIATVSVAIEGIKKFRAIDDKAKTENYLNISESQLSKLNMMVEKLLETATLDSNNLVLNKEPLDVKSLLELLVKKHELHANNKTISIDLPDNPLVVEVDVFHIENAISNIIDNAIKYGGDVIKVILFQNLNTFSITVSDNGTSLKKHHKDKIFEKFYRAPKGNTHDVKGFGIGLYYTKKIIEKHHGSITLELKTQETTFKIILPNA